MGQPFTLSRNPCRRASAEGFHRLLTGHGSVGWVLGSSTLRMGNFLGKCMVTKGLCV